MADTTKIRWEQATDGVWHAMVPTTDTELEDGESFAYYYDDGFGGWVVNRWKDLPELTADSEASARAVITGMYAAHDGSSEWAPGTAAEPARDLDNDAEVYMKLCNLAEAMWTRGPVTDFSGELPHLTSPSARAAANRMISIVMGRG